MKRINYVMAMLLVCIASVSAQVTIGDNTKPHSGAILELRTDSKGVLLPRINLEKVSVFQLDLEGTDTTTDAAGMLIYNTNATVEGGDGIGLYIWDGEKWAKIAGGNGVSNALKVTITPDRAPATITAGTTVDLTATVSIEDANTYQWHKNGVSISGATNKTYPVTDLVLGDRYSCEVTNSHGSATAYWSVCGANTVDGEWLVFMCHNLGADESLDPFTPVPGIYGDLYQWGRPADGHEKHESEVTDVLAASNIPGHAKFIIDADYSGDWWSGAGNNDARWGDGTDAVSPKKADNDPCPEGWKIPSQSQWASIYQGGTIKGSPSAATANTWSWVNQRGYQVGTSLFLPASGIRRGESAKLNDVGIYGFYWSSTTTGTISYGLALTEGTIRPEYNLTNRADGMAVRCVAE